MPLHEIVEFFSHAVGSLSSLKAPPPQQPSTPAKLRVGLGGDIPIAPPLFCLVCIGGGLAAPKMTGIDGALFRYLVPGPYYIPVRVAAAGFTLIAAPVKNHCVKALNAAGTTPRFQPVPSVADTGPYRYCRHPMYVAVLAVPALIGFSMDNFWVAFGSNALLWLYLNFVVVPAEEKFLLKELGDQYKKYCASVKRWGLF